MASRMGAARRDGLPDEVREAARLFLLNSLGTIVAGSNRPVVGRILAAASRLGSAGGFHAPARDEPLDLLWCATASGAAGHVDDFDDTHPVTYIHAGPTLTATCLALGQYADVTGSRLIDAIATGYEVQLRAALTISPEQYLAGWHSTGVFGVIGAAVAASVMLDLDDAVTATAIGLAATRVLGHQEGLGTMNKSFHAGKAAATGISAALSARAGIRLRALDDPLTDLVSTIPIDFSPRLDTATEDRGWHLLDNLVKPFPCGIVAHPGVEAAVLASARVRPLLDRVTRIIVRCSPLAASLTGNPHPTTELNTRLSLPHAVAAALVNNRAGLAEFAAPSIADPVIRQLRSRVELAVEDHRSEFSAVVRIEFSDADAIESEVGSVTGSPANPMSEQAVSQKFRDLVEPVLPGVSHRLGDAVEGLDQAASIRELYLLVRPASLAAS
jgi:2-methylcitrate dehydratase PrpD